MPDDGIEEAVVVDIGRGLDAYLAFGCGRCGTYLGFGRKARLAEEGVGQVFEAGGLPVGGPIRRCGRKEGPGLVLLALEVVIGPLHLVEPCRIVEGGRKGEIHAVDGVFHVVEIYRTEHATYMLRRELQFWHI